MTKAERTKDAAYWADVRADALKLIAGLGGPSAEELREHIKATQAREASEAVQLKELAKLIERKRALA
jgi:hypothetical protein